MPSTPLPGLWAAILSAIMSGAGLALTQGLISNHVEKLVTGFAAILLPLAFMIANAIHHAARARTHAAEITAAAAPAAPPAPGGGGG